MDSTAQPRSKLRIVGRYLLVTVLAIAGSLVLRVAYSHHVRSSAIKKYESRGAFLDHRALSPRVEADQNRAIPLMELAEAVKELDKKAAGLAVKRPLPSDLSGEQLARVRAIAAEIRVALEPLDAALDRPGVSWPDPLPSAGELAETDHLHAMRRIVNLLQLSAEAAMVDGRQSDALAEVIRTQRLADTVGHETAIVGHLVAVGASATGVQTISTAAWDPLAADWQGMREGVHGLVRGLLDETEHSRRLAKNLEVERVMQFQVIDQVRKETGVLGYKMNHLLPDILACSDQVALAAEAPNQWAARLKLIELNQMEKADNPLIRIIVDGAARLCGVLARERAERRLAATRLALLLYAGDHSGTYPQQLAALVPKYLPEIPQDPYSQRPADLRWDPDRRILWSVGEDMKDNEGQTRPGAFGEPIKEDVIVELPLLKARK